MLFLLTVVILVCLEFVWCQELSKAEHPELCEAAVKFGDQKFDLKFPANEKAAMSMARKVCIDKLPDTIDKERAQGQIEDCTKNIGRYLVQTVRKQLGLPPLPKSKPAPTSIKKDGPEEKFRFSKLTNLYERNTKASSWIVTVAVVIFGQENIIKIKPDIQTTTDSAAAFCEKNFASAIRAVDCQEPVESKLKEAIDKDIRDRMQRDAARRGKVLEDSGKSKSPKPVPPFSKSKGEKAPPPPPKFRRREGGASEGELLLNGEEFLSEGWDDPNHIQVTLNIAGQEYDISLDPRRMRTIDVAKHFCIKYAKEVSSLHSQFGEFDKYTMTTLCAGPIASQIDVAIKRQRQSMPDDNRGAL